MGRTAARFVYLLCASLMFALGVSLLVAGVGPAWFTAALGLFLCGFGSQMLAVALAGGPDQMDARTVWLLRFKCAFYLASGLAGGIAAFVYLPLPAAIIASVFVSIWIGLQGWMLAATRGAAAAGVSAVPHGSARHANPRR